MIAKWTALGLTVCLLIVGNCYADNEQTTKRTASGTLNYFPDDVQSREAWYGHNFIIDGMPIQPFVIHKEELLKYVGKRVKITGTWNEGLEFHDNSNPQILPMPIDAKSNKPVIRNEGINAEKIQLLNK